MRACTGTPGPIKSVMLVRAEEHRTDAGPCLACCVSLGVQYVGCGLILEIMPLTRLSMEGGNKARLE